LRSQGSGNFNKKAKNNQISYLENKEYAARILKLIFLEKRQRTAAETPIIRL